MSLASCVPLPPSTAPSAPPTRPQPEGPGRKGPAAPGSPAGFRLEREPSIDVGIGIDLDSLVVVPSQKARLRTKTGTIESPIGETAARIAARPARQGWQVSWREGGRPPIVEVLGKADTLWVGDEPQAAVAGPLAANGTEWRGRMWRGRLKLFLSPRGRLTLAARVPLETYLLGVVPAEIGGLAEELLEAGRAQAVAARSYTLFYKGRRGAEGFDLYGTVEDQVYGPVESERPLATRCVESTRGQVAVSGAFPIRANYCSTCGGISADVWEGWPADPLPYLVSHRDLGAGEDYCAASPHYRWREEWTAEEFLSDLETFGPPEGVSLPQGGIGELRDIRVASRSRSGRVWSLVVETDRGEVLVPAYVLRRVLRRPGGARSALRSNLFKVEVRRDRATRKVVGVVASGAGSGHGVGLCQTGAIGMARAGLSAQRILVHYYPGIELHRYYY